MAEITLNPRVIANQPLKPIRVLDSYTFSLLYVGTLSVPADSVEKLRGMARLHVLVDRGNEPRHIEGFGDVMIHAACPRRRVRWRKTEAGIFCSFAKTGGAGIRRTDSPSPPA